MRSRRLLLVALSALLSGAFLLGSPDRGERAHFEPGRTYTDWFYSDRTDLLWSRFSAAMRDAFGGSEANLADFRLQLLTGAGPETGVLAEREFALDPYRLYTRTASFAAGRTYYLQWSFSADEIVGFAFLEPQQPATSRFLDYQTQTPLRLPFDGSWRVFWGGRTVLENYHAVATDQRFAYDILGADEAGMSFYGDGSRNEDFPGFGRPILAPADGTVREAVDGIEDNVPPQTGAGHPAGNRVVIDHGNGEFSMFAHFRHGSLRVQAGGIVHAGDVLGECGNSGNSTAPHIHYHLQNTATWFAGEGLPVQFRAYVADGRFVAVGEPVRGQLLSPPLPPGAATRSSPIPADRLRPAPRL